MASLECLAVARMDHHGAHHILQTLRLGQARLWGGVSDAQQRLAQGFAFGQVPCQDQGLVKAAFTQALS